MCVSVMQNQVKRNGPDGRMAKENKKIKMVWARDRGVAALGAVKQNTKKSSREKDELSIDPPFIVHNIR